MSYRKQRALRRILSGRQRVTLRRSKNISFSEVSLQKAKDHGRERVSPRRLPVRDKAGDKSNEQKEFVQFQQEVRLAKLLERRLPENSPGEILKLPLPKLSFLEEKD